MKNVKKLVNILKDAGMNYMFDLLIGGPGETERTVRKTIEEVKRLGIPLSGIAAGVRVYPGTALSNIITDFAYPTGLSPQEELDNPLFYLSPDLGNDASSLIGSLVAGDSRFLFLTSPDDKQSYNYAGDEILCQLIEKGARGAYWDIIRQSQSHTAD